MNAKILAGLKPRQWIRRLFADRDAGAEGEGVRSVCGGAGISEAASL